MKTIVVIAIVFLAVLLTSVVLIINQNMANQNSTKPTSGPSATFSPTSTPASTIVPVARVIGNIKATPTLVSPTTSAGEVLIINGTVTNNSPNIAYNVGLNVTAFGTFSVNPSQEVIDITVPISSGTYDTSIAYPLSTLTPYQSVPINITIRPTLASHEPTLNSVTVTLVWSNAP
jgi:hypothetical protein